jgi:competence protein ComEA
MHYLSFRVPSIRAFANRGFATRGLAPFIVALALFYSQVASALPEGQVNINAAPAEQLAEMLDGVGAARAQAIVDYRERHGDFASLEDLLEVRGIGPNVIEVNRERMALQD